MALTICGNVIQSGSTYEWSVDKFSEKCKTFGESIWSPSFLLSSNNEYSWRMRLYPYGIQEENNGYISLYLYSRSKVTVRVSYEFTLNNVISLCVHGKYRNAFKPTRGGYGFPQFAERNKVLDDIKCSNDVLTIVCKLDDFIDLDNRSDSPIDTLKFEILNDIRQLFINKDFCDVTIKINAKEVKAHKVILSARSKAFADMFNNDMMEKVETVEINDMDCEVLEAMLKFIYTGEVGNVEKITKELLLAADKYGINELKNICIVKLDETKNITNVIDLLLFADLYNLDKLKTSIMNFIVTNAEDIICKLEFELLKDMPDLLNEFYSKQLKMAKNDCE